MNIKPSPYAGLHDLEAMKVVVSEGQKASPYSGYPYVGDLDWWLYYSTPVRGFALSDRVFVWENEAGRVVGWLYFTPGGDGFDTAILPELRGTACDEQIVAWGEEQFPARRNPESKTVSAFASDDDPMHCAMLEGRGYKGSEYLISYNQPLTGTLPQPDLPAGFTFLDRMREEDADRRADVHFNSFSPSRMTGEAYRHFMTAPGYDPELDVVIVAPDGRFAAFAMCWVDPVNLIGSFEPVGTRREMHRRGLGRAVMLEGLRRLQARGMKWAAVMTWIKDEGNKAFYQSLGFQHINTLLRYEKPVR